MKHVYFVSSVSNWKIWNCYINGNRHLQVRLQPPDFCIIEFSLVIVHVSDDLQQNASFTEQLITKIVDNLQISIKNIHIRYEDAQSNPGVSCLLEIAY
jgi:hypothetical protein